MYQLDGAGHESVEGSEWHGQFVEVQPLPTNQARLLLCDQFAYTVVNARP